MCRSKELTRFKSPQRSISKGRVTDIPGKPRQNPAQRMVYSVDDALNFLVGVGLLSVGQRTVGWRTDIGLDIGLNGYLVQWKLDTGAEVDVMA